MRAHLNQGQFAGVHILQPPTVDLMHSDLHRNHPQATPLAHGFIVQEQSSIRSIEHRGSMPGFLANLCLYPTQKMGIFVAQNTRTNRIANHITDAFFERYVAPIGQVVSSSEPKKKVLAQSRNSWTLCQSEAERIGGWKNQQDLGAHQGS